MKSPFKFLDSYTKDDREIFFGREREIEELYHRVFESKIMLVYGVSGTGKSSLIHCGLANKFQDTDWLPLVIRRGGNMPDSLADSIRSASITPQTGEITTPAQFRKAVRSIYLDHYKPIFFVFDQFEELFILGNREEKQNFIRIIKALHESDIQCRFIFILREEYMASITEFERSIPTIFQNRVRVEKMSHLNATDAIKGPCKVAGIELEEGFAESLLEKLSPEGSDVELTYLQVFLDKIFKLAVEKTGIEGPVNFNNNLLSQAGDVKDVLGSFLDEQVSLLPDPVMGMSVLKAYVTIKGTKRPATFEETIENVRSLGKDIKTEALEELIQVFIRLRLLTDKDNEGRYELRHDTLAEKIFEKFSLAEKELVELKLFIENAFQIYLKRKVLLNNDDLNYISNRDSFLSLNDDLREFITKCRSHQVVLRKAFRRLISISALATIILLATLVYTLSKKTKISSADKYAFESIYHYKSPLDRLCMASYAWQANEGENSKGALLEAFNFMLKSPEKEEMFDSIRYNYLKIFKPLSSPIEFALCSRNNKLIYGYSKDSVVIWDTDGKIISKFSTGKSPLIDLKISRIGDCFCGVSTDSVLRAWEFSGKLKFEKKIRYNPVNTSQVIAFTKDDNILTLSEDHDAELLDQEGQSIQAFDHPDGSINALDLSDDGRFIALGNTNSTIVIMYLNSDKKYFEVYDTITSHTDEIFSVAFAPNSRYVLSTSKDQTVKVTSINNDEYVWGRRKYIYPGEFNSIPIFPFLAEFDPSETGIVVKSFESAISQKAFVFGMYYNRQLGYALASAGRIEKYDYLSYSVDNQIYAYVSKDETSIASRKILNSGPYGFMNNYRLLRMSGGKPFFSYDGKYVYTIENNHIESWFIDIGTIAKISKEYFDRWFDLIY